MLRMTLIAGLAALAVACGGDSEGDSGVLQFTGRDETEANFRARVTEIKQAEPQAWVQLCAAIEEMSPRQAAAALLDGGSEDDEIPAGATPKPGQAADADDLVRAAEIVKSECDR